MNQRQNQCLNPSLFQTSNYNSSYDNRSSNVFYNNNDSNSYHRWQGQFPETQNFNQSISYHDSSSQYHAPSSFISSSGTQSSTTEFSNLTPLMPAMPVASSTSFSSSEFNGNSLSRFNNNDISTYNAPYNDYGNNNINHSQFLSSNISPTAVTFSAPTTPFDSLRSRLLQVIQLTRGKIDHLSLSNRRINQRLMAATSNKSAFLLVAPITQQNIQRMSFLNRKYARQQKILQELNQDLRNLQSLQLHLQYADINDSYNVVSILNEEFFLTRFERLNLIDDADDDDIPDLRIFNQSSYRKNHFSGVSDEILSNFPVHSFKSEKDQSLFGNDGTSYDDKSDKYESCCICVCDYEENETIMTLPLCNHHFHKNCVTKWLKRHITCPLCRQKYVDSL